MSLETHLYIGAEPGPRLAIMGGVHGNEVCGPKAIYALIDAIKWGIITITRGSLLLMPVANPQSYVENKRFIDENLNRVFMPVKNPQSYEQRLAKNLAPLLGECDALLDIHSIHSRGWPFTLNFGFFNQAEEDFIAALGLPYIVEGWAEAYTASFPGMDLGQSMHTAGFMRTRGKIAAGIECGQHDDPDAVDVATGAIRRALAHFQLIDVAPPEITAPQRVTMQSVYLRLDMADTLAQDFVHGTPVKAGDLLATRANGADIRAEEDGLVLFPRPSCPVGEEWFYTGRHKA